MKHSDAGLRVLYRKNEEIDDKSMIRRLRKRIAELETQLSLARTAEVILPTRTLQLAQLVGLHSSPSTYLK